MKAEIELVAMTLKRRDDLTPEQISAIIADLQAEVAAASEADEDKEKPVKKQWVIVAQDPLGKLAGIELTGFAVQIPEDESVYTAVERLHRAGYEFNTTKKGRRMPVRVLHEIVEHCPAKITKEQKVWVRSGKEPVFILPSSCELPREKPHVASAAARQIVAAGFGKEGVS